MIDYKKFILSDSSSIDKCIKKLNKNLEDNFSKLIIIINNYKKVVGTVTDGDIRRGFVKGYDIKESVKKIMNKNPKIIHANKIKEYENNYINFNFPIPIVEKNGIIKGVLNEENNFEKSLSNSIILMAGGFGKRLKPLTNSTPKPMLKIGERPIIEIIINSFVKNGFNNFLITTHYKSYLIKKYFGDGKKKKIKINYLDEKKPLGTAGFLKTIKNKRLTYPIIIMNSDILTKVNFKNLLKFHNDNKSDLTICTKKYSLNIPYGVIKNNKKKVINILEKPDFKFDINAGIYVLSKNILEDLNRSRYFDFDTLIKTVLKKNKRVISYPLYEYWMDIGKIDDLNQAKIDISSGIII